MTKEALMNLSLSEVIKEYDRRVKNKLGCDADKLLFISGFNFAITLWLEGEEE